MIENPIEGSLRLVARDRDKIVGHCLAARKEPHNELVALYVLPDYQKRGIGYLLAFKAINWLGQDKDITTEVVKYNQNAIRFYEKLGFVITGDVEPVSKLPKGVIFPEYQMIKRIT